MSDPFFFGYGSLVNRRTHAYDRAYPARVRGWRRVWRHTDMRDMAFLTADPAPDVEIEGLVAAVPGGDWAALDTREAGYDRHPVGDGIGHDGPSDASVQIFAIPRHRATGPEVRRPILLSYLDVVVQGFLHEFGEAGAARFFETTLGWDAPVLNDRAAPRYPRHQRLTARERDVVDAALADLGVRFLAD